MNEYEKGREEGLKQLISRLSKMREDCDKWHESLISNLDKSNPDLGTVNRMDMALHLGMGIDAAMCEAELVLFSSKSTGKHLSDLGLSL